MALSKLGHTVLKKIQKCIEEEKISSSFTAGILTKVCGEKISGNTLSSLSKHGYLVREGGSPVSYHLANQDDINALLKAENGPAENHDTMLVAKKMKRNEFYTHFEDIENEVMRYRQYFRDKSVFLNCNDGNWSEFYKFFVINFDSFGLRKLVSLDYNPDGNAKAYILEDDLNKDGFVDENDLVIEELNGTGGFETEESLKYLNECDIVVTNPPFSEFRFFVSILIESKKHFLIIGNNNALSYQEIFKYIKENKMWLGYNSNKTMDFNLPDNYQELNLGYQAKGEKNGKPYATVAAVSWFTNLPNKKRTEPQILINSYGDGKNYPHLDNHDNIIEVSRVSLIPKDYEGYMAVPITYLNVYCPEQFELLAIMASTTVTETNWGYPYINGKKKYARVIIKRRTK